MADVLLRAFLIRFGVSSEFIGSLWTQKEHRAALSSVWNMWLLCAHLGAHLCVHMRVLSAHLCVHMRVLSAQSFVHTFVFHCSFLRSYLDPKYELKSALRTFKLIFGIQI